MTKQEEKRLEIAVFTITISVAWAVLYFVDISFTPFALFACASGWLLADWQIEKRKQNKEQNDERSVASKAAQCSNVGNKTPLLFGSLVIIHYFI